MDQFNLNKTYVKLQNESNILDNLNVTYNERCDYFILWNRYQIFIYSINGYKLLHEIVITFEIAQVLASPNYLIIRDTKGIVHITETKLILASCLTKSTFFIDIAENAIFIEQDAKFTYILTITNEICNLLIYKLDQFSTKYSFRIRINKKMYSILNHHRCKMHCHLNNMEILFFISLDGFSVQYAIIHYNKTPVSCVELRNLVNCPSEINDIHYINSNILISLCIGTIIKIHWDTKTFKETKIMHLNTAIHRIQPVNDTLLYTDGQTMWRVNNIFTEDLVYKQCFVKLAKDFTIQNNTILCSTYGKNLYRFSINDETAFKETVSTIEYCSVGQLLKDQDFIPNIVTEIEKNDEIAKNIKAEENYITTLALSNRQDIVNDIIHYTFEVFDQYEHINTNCDVTLTNDIKDYYELDSYYLLVKLTVTSIHKKFTDILSNRFGNLEMHITLFARNKIVKTITLKILEQLKSMNIVIPLETDVLNNPKVTVLIELVISIPGALDGKQTLWTKLHAKEAVLNSEHFIRTVIPSTNIYQLKKTPDSTHLICENAIKHHGNLVKLINTAKKHSVKWQFFITLPENYREMLANEESYGHLNPLQRKLLMTQLCSDRFLTSRNTIVLNIAKDKVEIDIITGFPNDFLQTTSVNLQIASDMRNFLSSVLFGKQETSKDFVSNVVLPTIEDLKQQIPDCLRHSQPIDKFIPLHEKFQKNVLSRLNM